MCKFESDHSPCWAGCKIGSQPALKKEKTPINIRAKIRILRHCNIGCSMAFVKVGSLAALPPGSVTEVTLGEDSYAICNLKGDLHALWGICPHAGGPLVKVVLTPDLVPRFYRELFSLEGGRVHVSAGGNVAFVSIPSASGAEALDQLLRTLGVPGIALRGGGPVWCGAHKQSKLAAHAPFS